MSKTDIIMEKCDKCGCKKGHKMSCSSQKITINIEPTAKERANSYMKLKKGFKNVSYGEQNNNKSI